MGREASLLLNKTKKCTKCGNEKSLGDFYRDLKMIDGRCSWCKTCKNIARKHWSTNNPEKQAQTDRNRKINHPEKIKLKDRKAGLKRYGITLDEYDTLLVKQGHVCAICEKVCLSGRNLAIDHNHITGLIRGLLCMKCNRSLGGFDDSSDLLFRAISYLQNSPTVIEKQGRLGKWEEA